MMGSENGSLRASDFLRKFQGTVHVDPIPATSIKKTAYWPQGGGGGGGQDFKWWGWSNGDKNHNPNKIPRAANKTPKSPWTKNYSQKNPVPNLWALSILFPERTVLYSAEQCGWGARALPTEHYHKSSEDSKIKPHKKYLRK